MRSIRNRRAVTLAAIGMAAALGIVLTCGAASAPRTVAKAHGKPVTQAQAPDTTTPAPPEVRGTPANLQAAFTNEINARERYRAFADRADREGYRAVAELFRACARAEQVHSDRHASAIAWGNAEARAVLGRITVGTTGENLRAAIDGEKYESEQLYPAFIARARSEHQSRAVRSMNFALSAEREHARLLAASLASLEQCPPAHPIYVCSYCGKTVESLDFTKCPNCFTPAKKFIKVR